MFTSPHSSSLSLTQPWPRWHFSSFHYALIFRCCCCLLCAWVACLAYRTLQWPTRSAHTHTHTNTQSNCTGSVCCMCPWALFAVCFYHSILVLRFNDFIFSFVFSFHFTYYTTRLTQNKNLQKWSSNNNKKNTEHRTIITTVAYVSLWVPLTALLWSFALLSLRERRAKVETRMRIRMWVVDVDALESSLAGALLLTLSNSAVAVVVLTLSFCASWERYHSTLLLIANFFSLQLLLL